MQRKEHCKRSEERKDYRAADYVNCQFFLTFSENSDEFDNILLHQSIELPSEHFQL